MCARRAYNLFHLHDSIQKEIKKRGKRVLTEKPWIPFPSVNCVQNIPVMPRKSHQVNSLFKTIKSGRQSCPTYSRVKHLYWIYRNMTVLCESKHEQTIRQQRKTFRLTSSPLMSCSALCVCVIYFTHLSSTSPQLLLLSSSSSSGIKKYPFVETLYNSMLALYPN